MKFLQACGLAALIGGAALLVACVTAPGSSDPPPYAAYAGEPINQFTAFRFDNFEVLGDDTLAIWTRNNEAYLLRVWSTCQDLQLVTRIAMSSTGPTVSRGDSIRVRDQDCPIQEIRKIDIVRYKKDRAAAIAAAKAQAAGKAPADAVK
jgi:hypothetical protein